MQELCEEGLGYEQDKGCFRYDVFVGICPAENGSIWERETLTNGFGGLNDELADSGIEFGGGLTALYQANVKGSTNDILGEIRIWLVY